MWAAFFVLEKSQIDFKSMENKNKSPGSVFYVIFYWNLSAAYALFNSTLRWPVQFAAGLGNNIFHYLNNLPIRPSNE